MDWRETKSDVSYFLVKKGEKTSIREGGRKQIVKGVVPKRGKIRVSVYK